jgi:hypothetical protein
MLDDYDSVVIWCKKLDVGIGKATLGISGMRWYSGGKNARGVERHDGAVRRGE